MKTVLNLGWEVVGIRDNDMPGTVVTFAYDTAVSTATDALDELHFTAASHQPTLVVELMGR